MTLYLASFAIVMSLLSALTALFTRQQLCLFKCVVWLLNKNLPGIRSRSTQLTELAEYYFEPSRYSTALRILPFLLLGLSGFLATSAGMIQMLSTGSSTAVLPLGLPGLNWHLKIDALSGFFFCVLGMPLIAVSFFGPGYVREFENAKRPLEVLGFFTGIFITGMQMLLLADDAFFFMIAWEMMSAGSYFLVAFQHEISANRRAAFLYLIMAEVGAISIILGFGVLAGFADNLTFDALRNADLPTNWATIAFVLALLGFGMKAGLVPIHVWLPEAHPVAPSHISALMSGVMLKIAVYGFIRFTYDLLGDVQWQWGLIVLIAGAASSVFGVLYALMQHNLKRLLAYHSVENIGIIFLGLGLSLIFLSYGHPRLAVVGLIAALLHTLNHALFKSLLFLGAGNILHQTHEDDIERMGGLIHGMPKTAALFLIGCMAISALPPLNGFISEWLTFQAALQGVVVESGVLRSLIPVAAAALALAAALAAACFVKVYGTIFLGQPRSPHCAKAQESEDKGMLISQGLLAGLCFLVGIFPGVAIHLLNNVAGQLTGHTLPDSAVADWLWVAPVSPEQASYAAPLVLLGMFIAGAIWFRYLRSDPATVMRRSDPWDCGFGGLTPRMQYTSTSFSMPIRRIFAKAWQIEEHIDIRREGAMAQQVADIHYQLHVQDHSWVRIYLPIARSVNRLARLVGRIQTGNIRVYLGYSFATLILLLWVIS